MKNKIFFNVVNFIGLGIGYYMTKYMNYSYSLERNGEGLFLYFLGALIISIIFLFFKKDLYKKIIFPCLTLEGLSVIIILVSPEVGDAYFQIQKKTVAIFLVFILIIFSVGIFIYRNKDIRNKARP